MIKLQIITSALLVILGIETKAITNISIDSLNTNNIVDTLNITAKDTLNIEEDIELDGNVEENDIDSTKLDKTNIFSSINYPKNLPDSIYIQRLQAIESPLEFPFNNKIKAYIELYTERQRKYVENIIGLSKYYFPLFEKELDAAGLPLELKYLPIIESALNPKAFSRAGASGLWQFMYSTGKLLGLRVNSYVDDRRDPIKSTKAATKFLKTLYETYGDWYLALAAYNCGPGNVNKAIYRSGGKQDFWKIYYRLPRETRGYVPAFIAAAYVMNYYKDHGLIPKDINLSLATDTIIIKDLLHFDQISHVLNIPKDTLRLLNPQYRLDVIPGKHRDYTLNLPANKIEDFLANEDSIFAYNKKKYFASNRLVVKPSEAHYTRITPKNKAKLYYKVKNGDAVGLIADWYDVRTSDLKYWNNIRRNLIKTGQKLVVFVPKSKYNYYKKINTMSFAQKQRQNGKKVTTSSKHKKIKTPQKLDSSFEYYTVRKGDNFWIIAKKFPGISDTDIMNLNNIKKAGNLRPGQKLKIRKKS